uniref:LisH domain-containing protein n=1 Tax=Clastoptera arizonana TaxID=38151 RepID=A0A1B6D0Y7_9HEMI
MHRVVMIEKGLVEWLISFLSTDHNKIYSLEYSTALFMNLCLHEDARRRCPTTVLKLLTDLMSTQHIQVLPVIAGALYCLLSRDDMNAAASKMNLNQVLASHLENGGLDSSIRKQIETLMKVHAGEIPVDCVQMVCEETQEDELDDPEFLERELDDDDPIHALVGEAEGRKLLETQYKKKLPSHNNACSTSDASAKQEVNISVLPTTPRSRPPTQEK